ncbi:hypothetical protein FB451DRAFT_1269336 [Mycena latifolia]|nr:hypothetical protein FB451DRAFT_1269336 [Mycena latifolia]
MLKQRESSLAGLKDVLNTLSGQRNGPDPLALVHHFHYLERVIFPLLHSPRLWNSLAQPLRESADLVEQVIKEYELADHLRITFAYALADYRHTTNRLGRSRFHTSLGFAATLTVPSFVIAGLCCFMAGVLCLVLDSQPFQVWATSCAVLGGTVILLAAVLASIIGVAPRAMKDSEPFAAAV